MLDHLSIRNYALIRSLELDFRTGFTILTGETGAGKSILLGALNLLLGERFDTNSIKDSAQKCIVEARFTSLTDSISKLFEEYNLDLEHDCILRREITPNGKSRAFVNDTPVTLQQLKQIGTVLVDIHGQHDTVLINQDAFRIQFIDGPSHTIALQKSFESLFNKWNKSEKLLKQLKAQQEAFLRESDFIRFQLDELDVAAIQDGELQKAEEEFRWMNNATEISKLLNQAVQLADSESHGIQAQCTSLGYLLRQAERMSDRIEPLALKLAEITSSLADLSFELNREAAHCESNPIRLQELAERIDLINKLLHKHRLKNETELAALQADYRQKLQGSESLDEEINEQEIAVQKLLAELNTMANDLHNKRLQTIPTLSKSMVTLLQSLGMPDVRFEIKLKQNETFDRFGNTHVALLFSANKGSELFDISKTASGGERSRVMLALKKIMASSVDLPTIVFDEIDTGVSGAVADAVGVVLQQMGQSMQVLCITHLAQIAAKGNDHLKVLKRSDGEQTETHIVRLNADERTDEIAAMLSGKELSAEARLNAKALMEHKTH